MTATVIHEDVNGRAEQAHSELQPDSPADAAIAHDKLFNVLVENNPDAFLIVDRSGVILFANQSACKLFENGTDNLIGSRFGVPLSGGDTYAELEIVHEGCAGVPVEMRVASLPWGAVQAHVVSMRDISDRIQFQKDRSQLEQSLRSAQKMEVIGTLAGGIAHDFNNILSAIMGYAELCALDHPENGQTQEYIEHIVKAGTRAKDLIRQILSFSHGSEKEPRKIHVAPIIKEVMKLLRASIPATIRIEYTIDKHLGIIEMDPTNFHQVVMNLCTNAAHAMTEQGGVLTVDIVNLEVKSREPLDVGRIHPGDYVRMTVADTGCGMPADVCENAFKAHFTTKQKGQGTGLGLSVVKSIVESCDGAIRLWSRAGEGSRFHVYFPCAIPGAEVRTARRPTQIQGGREHILFVDDEPSLTKLVKGMLKGLGYRVTVCNHASLALELLENRGQTFDMLITDFIMPGMTGKQLTEKARWITPHLPVIVCSGFCEPDKMAAIKDCGADGYIAKPFVIESFSKTIREVLESADAHR